MCGILGFCSCNATLTAEEAARVVEDLLVISESRGKEAAGVALARADCAGVFKRAQPASHMVKTPEYHGFIASHAQGLAQGGAVIGHSRLVTNGSSEHPANNQPVCGKQAVTVHNGIIVNVEQLWAENEPEQRRSDVDTEVFVHLLEKRLRTEGVPAAFAGVYRQIYGMASTLTLLPARRALVAATNNGSLYSCQSQRNHLIVFASESSFLEALIRRNPTAHRLLDPQDIRQLKPNEGLLVEWDGLRVTPFSFDAPPQEAPLPDATIRIEENHEAECAHPHVPVLFDAARYAPYEIDDAPIRKLRRCTRCVLPETMPFIEFDEEGVCNYCRGYKPQTYMERSELMAWADSRRSPNGERDSIVAFSGGRDSSYGLHYFVKELGLHPVAFSYDWGMVTDLARRNQSRMCASLGVELILISADIRKKRDNIRRNVAAWLKKPDLGIVPIFMAGDKQYFWYANEVRKRYGLDTLLMANNPFERTHFKSGFCGSRPVDLQRLKDAAMTEKLQPSGVLRMAAHYAGQYLANPAYLNRSVWDTAGATLSYYVIPHDYFRLFNYIPWDEREINETLLGQYDWEISPDSQSTWRIGDGTAPFYNYIYYLVAGFTENDTLRSNQIREGMLSRDEALELVYRDNRPRFESMQWYFDVIGLDMEAALRRINQIPRLYPV